MRVPLFPNLIYMCVHLPTQLPIYMYLYVCVHWLVRLRVITNICA